MRPTDFGEKILVGCVAVAAGDQGATATLTTLRTIAHALRAWPTPLGVAATGPSAGLDAEGGPADDCLAAQLQIMFGQVLTLAVPHARRRSRGVQLLDLVICQRASTLATSPGSPGPRRSPGPGAVPPAR